MEEQNSMVFFAGRGNKTLGKEIVRLCGKQANIKYTIFADGEYKPQLEENVRGKVVFIIQSTNATIDAPANNLWELLLLIDAAKRASAEKVIAVIPYFGNARQERKSEPRTPITAKLSAKIIEAAGADRIITMDLHSDAIQGFFEIPVDNLYASYMFVDTIKDIINDNTIFASADAGGVSRVGKYAKYFNKEMIVCTKIRAKDNEVEKVTVIGNPENKDIIIIDDIIDTAGTMSKVCDALKQKGAKKISIFSSHGVLSGNAYQNIEKSAIDRCYISDSLDNASIFLQHNPEYKKIQIISCANLFAKAINRNIEKKSIKELFLF